LCKFFEYIFEPALQRNNKFFYDVDFHKFVANVLYLHFQVRAGSVPPGQADEEDQPSHAVGLAGVVAGQFGVQTRW
jgi:hypothetical protein